MKAKLAIYNASRADIETMQVKIKNWKTCRRWEEISVLKRGAMDVLTLTLDGEPDYLALAEWVGLHNVFTEIIVWHTSEAYLQDFAKVA